jgi:RimJ/RimL family protein N-acetyltransferase
MAVALPTYTERLRLEPVGAADVDDIAAMLADPHVAATMAGVRDRAWTEQRTLVHAERWVADGFGFWAAFSREDNGFVGRGGIQHTTLEGAYTLPFNEASLAVMRRLGMTYQRDCVHVDVPHVVYAIRQLTRTA